MPLPRSIHMFAVIGSLIACGLLLGGCGDGDVPPLGTAKPPPSRYYPTAPRDVTPPRSGKVVPRGYTAALVGMVPKAASDKIQRDGYVVRISSYNGKRYPVTKDYNPGRITLTIVKNRVATAVSG